MAEKKAPKAPKRGTTGNAVVPARSTKVPAIIQDPLERKVGIAATLGQDGLHVKADSRLVAAIDRLGGNLVDWVNMFVEPGLNRRRDAESLANAIREVDHQRALENAEIAPLSSDAFLRRHFEQRIYEDRNRLMITLAAIDDLKREPEPELSHDVATPSLDPDWLNELAEIAGRKSDADMQKLWGRLLAGEIRNPGTFKLRTLQKLSAIDSGEANHIHEFLILAISNAFIFRSDPFVSFNKVLEMEDLGVVQSGGGLLHNTWEIGPGSLLNLVFCNTIIQISSETTKRIQIPCYPLTAFGEELSALILFEDVPRGYIDALATLFTNHGFLVELADILDGAQQPVITEFSKWAASTVPSPSAPIASVKG